MSRIGISGFESERLIQLLEMRGIKQSKLAEIANVSASTVSKWVNGSQSPEIETLNKLSAELQVKPDWFTRKAIAGVKNINFRSNADALRASRVRLKSRVNLSQEFSMGFEEYVDYPEADFPVCNFQSVEEIGSIEIEAAAQECRKRWGVGSGPIQDLAMCFENAGGILIREETGISNIEGLSGWSTYLNRPIVLLNADKANKFRSRFDLAHEIGHIVLHHYISYDDQSDDDEEYEKYNLMEKQAHSFAGALLMPAERFAEEITVPITLNGLVLLKRKWGASVGAMVMRLFALRIIDGQEKTNLFKRISQRWGRKSEPLDDEFEPEQPRLLKRTLELLVNEGIMTPQGVLNFLSFGSNDVAKICSVNEVFFDENKVLSFGELKLKKPPQKNNEISSTVSNVLPFPTKNI